MSKWRVLCLCMAQSDFIYIYIYIYIHIYIYIERENTYFKTFSAIRTVAFPLQMHTGPLCIHAHSIQIYTHICSII